MIARDGIASVASSAAASSSAERARARDRQEAGAYAAAARETWSATEIPVASSAIACREVIRYASLAPSIRNAQPWNFRARAAELFIHPDFRRRVPLADPCDEQLFIALGAAAENASIAARAFGLHGEVAYYPQGRGGLKVDLSAAPRIAPSALFHAIPRRQSSRGLYDGRSPSVRELEILEHCAADLGVSVVLITDEARLERVRELVRAADLLRSADRQYLAELKQWIRFNDRDALQRRDGLLARSAGHLSTPRWFGASVFDFIMRRNALSAQHANRVRSSGGVAILFGGGRDPRHWTAVGRACERFLLRATVLNLRVAMVSAPIEVRATRLDLGAEFGSPSSLPDAMIRFGYGTPSLRSLRRPLYQVIL